MATRREGVARRSLAGGGAGLAADLGGIAGAAVPAGAALATGAAVARRRAGNRRRGGRRRARGSGGR